MKNQDAEIMDATLSQIETTINRLSNLHMNNLDNADTNKVCSKILAFAEQLNSFAYSNLSSLEAEKEARLPYLSLLKHIR